MISYLYIICCFIDNDISWLNPTTGEIKFSKTFNSDDLKVFQRILFSINKRQLFSISTYVRLFTALHPMIWWGTSKLAAVH